MSDKIVTVAISAIVAFLVTLGTEKLSGYIELSPTNKKPASDITSSSPELEEQQMELIVIDVIKKNPQVIVQALTQHMQEEQKAQIEKLQAAVKENHDKIFAPTFPSLGGNDKSPSVAVFYDYRCGYCKKASTEALSALQENPDMHIIFIDLPIFGGESIFFAKMGLAAEKQGKFAQVHEALMAAPANISEQDALVLAQNLGLNMDQLKKDMDSPEIEQVLQENMHLAQTLGLSGTPAFVIEDELIPGFIPKEALLKKVQEKRTGQTDQNNV